MDIKQIRNDTPGVQHVKHFNNAGAALQPKPVIEKIRQYQEDEYLYGGYETAAKYKSEIDNTYSSVANLIGARPGELALVENATTAWDMAFHSLKFQEGDRILTSVAEYASNFIGFLQAKKRFGVQIEVIPNDTDGQIDLEILEAKASDGAKLIAVNHMPTNSGLVNPVVEIGQIARLNNITYLVDACQSIGQVPIRVSDIQCDFLSATGRKYLRGPRGTGFLYVSERMLKDIEPIFLDLHSAHWISEDSYRVRTDARRFENWECNYSLRLGLKMAAEYALKREKEGSWVRVQELGASLRTKLSEVPRVHVYDQGKVLGGIVTFSLDGLSDKDLSQELHKRDINVAVGPGNAALLDMQAKHLKSLIRASVHYYNTHEEIEYFVHNLKAIANAQQ